MNILNNFFNSASDASKLEASEQEKLELEFKLWFDEKMKDFNFASEFLIRHMAEHHIPHEISIVDSEHAILYQGIRCENNDKYLVD